MTSKIPLTEAMELLTLGEIKAIEKHEGFTFGSEGMSGTSMTGGIVWALERRKALEENKPLPTWADIDAWTLRDLNGYFSTEETEFDPSAPETDSGKGD